MSLDLLAEQIRQWQNETFPTRDAHAAAHHLRREADELLETFLPEHEDGRDEEIADVFFLLVAVADRNGTDLSAAVAAKLAKNKLRRWKAPDADGVVEHEEG